MEAHPIVESENKDENVVKVPQLPLKNPLCAVKSWKPKFLKQEQVDVVRALTPLFFRASEVSKHQRLRMDSCQRCECAGRVF